MARKQSPFGADVQRYWQFEFDRQWSALREYCRQRGIRIMGDLPIYVADDSSDVVSHPELLERTLWRAFLPITSARAANCGGIPFTAGTS